MNIFQSENGFLQLNVQDKKITLTLEQIDELEIDTNYKTSIWIDHDKFIKAYGLPF